MLMSESALQMPHLTQTRKAPLVNRGPFAFRFRGSWFVVRGVWGERRPLAVAGGRTRQRREENGEDAEEDVCGAHGCV